VAENRKSDVNAKEAFRDILLTRGYESAVITATPADITAVKAGTTYYFEIKFTNKSYKYFGAATLTEWGGGAEVRGSICLCGCVTT